MIQRFQVKGVRLGLASCRIFWIIVVPFWNTMLHHWPRECCGSKIWPAGIWTLVRKFTLSVRQTQNINFFKCRPQPPFPPTWRKWDAVRVYLKHGKTPKTQPNQVPLTGGWVVRVNFIPVVLKIDKCNPSLKTSQVYLVLRLFNCSSCQSAHFNLRNIAFVSR